MLTMLVLLGAEAPGACGSGDAGLPTPERSAAAYGALRSPGPMPPISLTATLCGVVCAQAAYDSRSQRQQPQRKAIRNYGEI
jgi:hypothetical protein